MVKTDLATLSLGRYYRTSTKDNLERLPAAMKPIPTLSIVVLLAGCVSHSYDSTQSQSATVAEESPTVFSYRTMTVVLTNPVVFVGGEVVHPGMISWAEGITLTNAIALAGGFTEFADKRRLEIRRRSTGSVETYSYQQAVSADTSPPALERGDVLRVRRRFGW